VLRIKKQIEREREREREREIEVWTLNFNKKQYPMGIGSLASYFLY
jgi:hypothetical protein